MLSAGELDGRAPIRLDAADHFVHRHLAAFVKGIRRVAPSAAQIAGRQAHEHTGPAGVRGLALNRMKDLVDRQHSATRKP